MEGVGHHSEKLTHVYSVDVCVCVCVSHLLFPIAIFFHSSVYWDYKKTYSCQMSLLWLSLNSSILQEILFWNNSARNAVVSQNIEYQEVNINSGTHMHLPLKPGTTSCSVSIHTPCFINIRIRISADK